MHPEKITAYQISKNGPRYQHLSTQLAGFAHAPHGQNCHAQTMMVHEVHSMPGYGRGLCGKPVMCRYVWTPGSLCSTKVEGYCTCYKLGGGAGLQV